MYFQILGGIRAMSGSLLRKMVEFSAKVVQNREFPALKHAENVGINDHM